MAKIVSHAKDCNRWELLTKRPPCAFYLTASSAGRIALRARGVVLGGQAGRPLAGWGQRPQGGKAWVMLVAVAPQGGCCLG